MSTNNICLYKVDKNAQAILKTKELYDCAYRGYVR